jgi:ATP-binding protein involved in chromosome partitioning
MEIAPSPPVPQPPVKPSYSLGAFGLKITKRPIPGVQQVIVVASGKGGVGKSTVASNLACALAAQGLKVGLLDADIYGPSAPTMFGVHKFMAVDSEEKLIPARSHGVAFASFGLLIGGKEPVIWRGPLLSKAITQLCYDVRWGELDYLIVDLPPGTGDVQITLLEQVPIAGAIVVSTPQEVALIDAEKAYGMFTRLATPVLGVVANMMSHHCANCGHEEHIFGEEGVYNFAAKRNLPLLASLPLNSKIRQAADQGELLGQLDSKLAQLFDQLAHKVRAFFYRSVDEDA